MLSRLDQRDLPRDGAGHEVRAAPRAGVVEAARDDEVQPVRLEVLIGELVLRHLAHGVRRERSERVRLFHRDLVRIDEAVLLGRAGNVHADLGVVAADRLEDVELRLDVDAHRRGGLVEG